MNVRAYDQSMTSFQTSRPSTELSQLRWVDRHSGPLRIASSSRLGVPRGVFPLCVLPKSTHSRRSVRGSGRLPGPLSKLLRARHRRRWVFHEGLFLFYSGDIYYLDSRNGIYKTHENHAPTSSTSHQHTALSSSRSVKARDRLIESLNYWASNSSYEWRI